MYSQGACPAAASPVGRASHAIHAPKPKPELVLLLSCELRIYSSPSDAQRSTLLRVGNI
jgi:hypothetical protein